MVAAGGRELLVVEEPARVDDAAHLDARREARHQAGHAVQVQQHARAARAAAHHARRHTSRSSL